MNCPHCGKPLKDGAKFCLYCGEKVAPAAQPAVETAPAAPAPVPVVEKAPAPQPQPAPQPKVAPAAAPAADLDKTVSIFDINPSAKVSAASGAARNAPEGSILNGAGAAGAVQGAVNAQVNYDYSYNNYDSYGNSDSQENGEQPAASINNKPLVIIAAILAVLVIGIGVYLGIFLAGNSDNSKKEDEEPSEETEEEGCFGWENYASIDFIVEE